MPVSTACSSCSAKIKVKDELVGKSIKCPKCGKVFKVAPQDAPQEMTAVKTNADAKPGPKKPPPAWADDDDDDADQDEKKSSPWDKQAKSKDDDAGKRKAKALVKKDDDSDDDDDEDDEDAEVGSFDQLLADTQLPDATKKMIRNELSLREKGVWIGQPCPKIMTVRALGKSAAGLFVITIFAFIIGIGGSMSLEKNWFIAAGGAACFWFALALLVIVGIPFMDHRKALATAYVVTNKRAIAFTGRWFGGPAQESFYPDLLQHMRRMQSWIFGADSGDLVFRSVTTITTTHHRRGGSSTSVSTTYYGFLGIRNLDAAARIIREVLLRDDDDDDDDDDEKPRKKKKKRRDDDDDD